MQSNIEVRFLTPKEMANARDMDWRYEHVKGDNLGFADKEKNKIFVRAGLDKELTKYLVDHELNHLFELEGTDEDENGIRHKGNFFDALLASIDPFNLFSAPGTYKPDLYPGQHNPSWTAPLTALGTMVAGAPGAALGQLVGSSVTGKPDWAGAAKTFGTGTVSDYIGEGLGLGNLAGQAAGTGANMAFGAMSQTPNYGGMWNTRPSGFSEINVPTSGLGMGFTPSGSAPGGVGTGGQSGSLAQIAGNAGTGQAGIALGAQQGVPNTGQSGAQSQGMEKNNGDPWGNSGMNMNNMETGFQPIQI